MFNNGISVPLVAGIDGNNNGMFGSDGWLGLIVIIALLGGGFGNGFGFGGNRDCATQADVRSAVDQQTLISKIDEQTYGMANSFNSLNNAIMSGFHGVDNSVCTLGYNVQSGFNSLSSQLAQCCCDNRAEIADVKYQMATQSCETRQAIADSTKSILDFIVNDKLATLQAENQSLKLKASQAEQNAYLLNELKPCPSPSYIVPNPNCCYNSCGGYGYGVVGA